MDGAKSVDLNALFAAVGEWATTRADIRAVALTDAQVASDVDRRSPTFLLLTAVLLTYSHGEYWPSHLGSLVGTSTDDSGTTLRIAHREGLLLMLRFATPSWFESEHARLLKSGGMLPLFDHDHQLSAALEVVASAEPEPPPPRADITYPEWLALNSAERREVLATWNPYQHDNIHIPREAARRLRENCAYPCATIDVGVYHMGEYILSARLVTDQMTEAEIAAVPEWLSSDFDGFRIGYQREK